MKKDSFARKRIYPVLFMLIVTVVFISVTTVIYTFTRETIKLNERLRLKRAVLYAAGVRLPDDPAAIERAFDNRASEIKDDEGNVRYYEIRGEGTPDIESYVVILTGAGLWGEITAGIGFDGDLESLKGIEVIDQNETPGLGGRIDEAWFKEQFMGKRPPLSSVPEGDPATDREFQAITGASYSTEAIQNMVNEAREYARTEIEGMETEGTKTRGTD
jgi:Na+-transporting NADH:ubiquinone oxidoreductase subunit C